ncbi:MAG: hypothetical protein CL918_01065 [Deltaproteobacteria bacterium]|nr:hypothetical protein [Deltaproteobacteria bacterium]
MFASACSMHTEIFILQLFSLLSRNILFLNKGKLESTQPAQTFFREPMSNNASKFIAGDIVE